jgi:hypothetical protein
MGVVLCALLHLLPHLTELSLVAGGRSLNSGSLTAIPACLVIQQDLRRLALDSHALSALPEGPYLTGVLDGSCVAGWSTGRAFHLPQVMGARTVMQCPCNAQLMPS